MEGKATPLAAGSVRAPGARRGRAPRGPAEAAACVVLFLDRFQLWGKKTFVSSWWTSESRIKLYPPEDRRRGYV